ncbi:MAG: hypothetical protein KC502_18955 [Myxococcales bacterium]|nr:hypothetical protein [Myxococcales bacterium]
MKKATIQLMALIAIVAMAVACGSDPEPTTTTDAGTTAADGAVDAASDATTTNADPGCTSADDQAFNKLLTDDKAKGGAMATAVSNCTLKKGCLGKADADAKKNCIRDCLLEDALLKDNKVSSNCAACYGTYKGFCGADKCITDCAADPSSAGCSKCLETNCDPDFSKCVSGK